MNSCYQHRPHSLLLQWHITERCNLRCSHCYQESYGGKELPYEALVDILEQFKTLLRKWQPIRGHITITGGEPFVRKDFLDLLELFATHRDKFSFGILTNGSLIDEAKIKQLQRLNPSFVQVSIEGTAETHNAIRGEGDFERTVETIKRLVAAKIRTHISFTAHKANFQQFPEVARLGRKLRVARVWADRLIPWGSGADHAIQGMTPSETEQFFRLMEQAREEANRFWGLFNRTEIAMHRALQFLVGGGRPYYCTAGDSLITVQPNGDLYPCRRMPISVGNLLETPLNQLYYESELFQALRDRDRISKGCEGCFYTKLCRGGLKCLSYAVTGDPFQADPGCWHATQSAEPLPQTNRNSQPISLVLSD